MGSCSCPSLANSSPRSDLGRCLCLGCFWPASATLVLAAWSSPISRRYFLASHWPSSLSSIGYSAIFSSVYTLATGAVSRRYRASMLSVIETAFGVGMMIGPSVGGVLYDVGGFNLPFYITGTLLVISSCVTL